MKAAPRDGPSREDRCRRTRPRSSPPMSPPECQLRIGCSREGDRATLGQGSPRDCQLLRCGADDVARLGGDNEAVDFFFGRIASFARSGSTRLRQRLFDVGSEKKPRADSERAVALSPFLENLVDVPMEGIISPHAVRSSTPFPSVLLQEGLERVRDPWSTGSKARAACARRAPSSTEEGAGSLSNDDRGTK